MNPTDTRPGRDQTDAEILTALDIEATIPAASYRLDRTDPYRILVIAADPAGAEAVAGAAVLEHEQGAYYWALRCTLCFELAPAVIGLCPDCHRWFAIHEATETPTPALVREYTARKVADARGEQATPEQHDQHQVVVTELRRRNVLD